MLTCREVCAQVYSVQSCQYEFPHVLCYSILFIGIFCFLRVYMCARAHLCKYFARICMSMHICICMDADI
jgi:hypothetical protein